MTTLFDGLWSNALTVIPLVVLVAVAARCLPLRSTTRHALWVSVMAWLLVGGLLPGPPADLPDVQLPEVAVAVSRRSDAAQRPQLSKDGLFATPRRVREPRVVIHAPVPATSWPAPSEAGVPRSPLRRSSTPAASGLALERTVPALRVDTVPRGMEAVVLSPTGPLPSSPVAMRERVPVPGVESGPNRPAKDGSIRAFAAQIALRAQTAGDAIAGLPGIPLPLWWGGIGALILLHAVRATRFRRDLSDALPAPTAIRRQVEAAAERIGLRGAPDTHMVRARLSPMVWCPWWGGRPRLLLPIGLWLDLDPVGRNAVLFHELAHIRRRDHWVRRGVWCIGILYWWNPVVWWVRSRLDEEAETCCDNWVTWLLPRGRRAYAEALLRTTRYLEGPCVAGPAVGLGITTQRARRFARRLTMVMTCKNRPGLSICGLVVVAALGLAGWWMSPATACPPTAPTADAAVPTPPRAPRFAGVPRPAPVPIPSVAPFIADGPAVMAFAPQDADSYRVHMAQRGTGDVEERLARLEAQLARMAERMEPSAAAFSPFDAAVALQHVEGESGEYEVDYVLPSGRLDDLTELMSRQDVPIFIRPGDGHITVIGNAGQHAAFKAFVALIYPEGATGAAAGTVWRHNLASGTSAAFRANIEAFNAARRDLVEQRQDMYRQARELYNEALRRESEADLVERESEFMEELTDGEDKETRRETFHAVQDLARRMIELRHQATELNQQAEEFESRADLIDEEVDRIEAQIEAARSQSQGAR